MTHRTLILGGGAALVLAASVAWWALSPAPQPADRPAATAGPAAPDGVLPLSATQVRALGIEIAAAQPAGTLALATLPATLAPQPNARQAVAAQLPGIVTRIFVVDGQAVARGEPLATVASRDIVSLGADLARARSRHAVASAQAGRLRQLAREGIIAPSRSDEASALAAQSAIDVAEQNRLIALLGGGRAGGSGYTLVAPIAGRISSMTAEVGKTVDPSAAPFVIDGTGPLQVSAQLPERLIGSVRPGMAVRIGREATGRVLAVGSTIDPMTRSATVTAEVPPGPGLVPGSATSIVIEGPAPAGSLRIPAGAVVRQEEQAIVFVVVRGGVVARRVTLAEGGGQDAVVIRGLRQGDRVVTRGVSELASLAGAR